MKTNVNNFLLVVASNNDPVSHFYMAPYIGAAIAKYYSTKGFHCVVFIDSLYQHAIAYREICLDSGNAPGKDGFPGDLFKLYGDLLEHACSLPVSLGKGSVSFLPIIDTVDDDIGNFLCTTVISITDGQIILQNGEIQVHKSVSRVGNAIQNKFLKKYSSSLKQKLSRYEQYLQSSKLSAVTTEEAKVIIKEGDNIKTILAQDFLEPRTMAQQILYGRLIYSGMLKNLDQQQVHRLNKYINELDIKDFHNIEHIDKYYNALETYV